MGKNKDGNDKKDKYMQQLERTGQNLELDTTNHAWVDIPKKELTVSANFFEELNKQTLAEQGITISTY